MTETRDTWRILLIDDDEEDFLITRRMLSKAQGRKVEIEWAKDYQEGMDRLRSGSFDAALVDYDLGPHSGIELIRQANQEGCQTPMILSTGRGSYAVDVEAMQAGASLYLAKAEVNPLLLERSIRYSIERKQSELALKNTADLLAQSNQALTDFAFVASHDLQEPLHTIQSLAGQLRCYCNDQTDLVGEAIAQRMQEAVQRMSSMLSNLLDYSRVNTRGMPFEDINLSEMTEDVLADLEVLIQNSAAHISVEGLETIEGDPLQFYQLIQNLITNAIKYHRPGLEPVVKITGQRIDRDWFELCVSDNGIGFDPEYAEEIFRPFFRLEADSQVGGTGIGLAICRKIAERHHGYIRVTSQPGQGSRFMVRLPVHQKRAAGG